MTGRPQAIVHGSRGPYSEPVTAYVWIAYSSRWQRPSDPVFHRENPSYTTADTDSEGRRRRGWKRETTCGLLVYEASWIPGVPDADYRSSEHGLELPIRWALQFGRPCKRCWP